MTKIISADGKPIRELYIEQRDIVNIAKVPQDLRKGLVLMEDRKFFDHPGIDIWSIVRAVSVRLIGGRTQGASTLTQQLARNMYSDIGFEKSYIRKVREAITAYNIENVYTKSEIMELYLNSVFFGHRAYGVQQASKYYFGKDVKELNLNECATLVGILPAPNTYSPKKNINTVIGHSDDFYNSDYKIFDNNKKETYLKTAIANQYFPLTKIDGELAGNTYKIKNNGKDLLFSPRTIVKIDGFLPNSNAKKAGLLQGDVLVSIDGVTIKYFDEATKELQNHKSKIVNIGVLRDGEKLDFPVQVTEEAMKIADEDYYKSWL